MRAAITDSKLVHNGQVWIFWNDGVVQRFDAQNVNHPAYVDIPMSLRVDRAEMDRRDAVAATSARCTFNGTGC